MNPVGESAGVHRAVEEGRRRWYVGAPMRHDGRTLAELRPCTLEAHYLHHALGSVLISTGRTRVLCSASLEPKAPPWLAQGGWVTAEYSMLPGSTQPRARRDPGGRGKEIQRLIGRSLRAAVDLSQLVGPDGGLSIICDCDVLDADGGTRTASVTGAFVALAIALHKLRAQGILRGDPLRGAVAAVSVGMVELDGLVQPMLDLDYIEDSTAHVDLNVVKVGGEGYAEVQGTAEGKVFRREDLTAMLELADAGIAQLQRRQAEVLESLS